MRDIFGTVLSGLCICHCILPPIFLLGGASGVVSFLTDFHDMHMLVLMPVILVALYSFPLSYWKHRNKKPLLIASIGLAFLVFGVLVESYLHWHIFEIALTLIGGISMVFAHMMNRKLNTLNQHQFITPGS